MKKIIKIGLLVLINNLNHLLEGKEVLHFIEISNGLGYVGNGNIEKSLKNEKMFFKPSYIAEIGLQNVYKNL